MSKIPLERTMFMAEQSAGTEARRRRHPEAEHRRRADDADQQAARCENAERTESGTARVLAPLAGIGLASFPTAAGPAAPPPSYT